MVRVVFICTGNTCRSPMAEVILKNRSENIEVKSAGVFAANGAPASHQVETLLTEKKLAFTHRAQMLDRQLAEWGDILLTMTSSHKALVLRDFPDLADKVYTLKEYAVDEEKYDEYQQKAAEIEMKRAAFSHDVTSFEGEEERVKRNEFEAALTRDLDELRELEDQLPSMDISDPFGGTIEQYRETYHEIEAAVDRMLERMNRENGLEG
ncbi:low molecular weight protein arginine phosphatase [Pseudalkalibacillus hwajinpoensis]|uniref:low molecular weight protein arginine phosphatase n=1 Tax=Guptibacillus hwajinpoensis TaxID=208199 RepID=UPI00325A654C